MGYSLRLRWLSLVLGFVILLPPGARAQGLVDVLKAAAAATEPTERVFYQDLADIHKKLAQASGLTVRLLVADDEEVNAYATEEKGQLLVVLNWGLIDALQNDRDAIAAVLAHEYAHHGKEHISKSKSTAGVLGFLGALAGAAIDYKLGTSHVGQQIGRTGAKVLSRSFSRDQEREADMLGTQWLIAAGYNPMGAVRLQQKFTELAGTDDNFSLFRTHPPSKERAAELQQYIANNPQAKPLLEQPLVALNLPEDTDDEDSPSAMAAAGGGGGAGATGLALVPPSAASLAPTQGFSLERYARYVNELAAAPDAQQTAVMTKYGLTQASADQLNETWVQRMQADSALGSAYGVVYLETAVGPFAAHAKDVAIAQRTGAALVGDAPIPQADWIALSRLQRSAYAAHKDNPQAASVQFALDTKAKGYSPYDFQIASHWWFAVARQKALSGDTRLLVLLSADS